MSNSDKVLIVDFMYLWNRVYSIKGKSTGSHIYSSLCYVDDSNYYSRKFVILDGYKSTSYRRALYPEYKTNRGDKSSIYEDMEKFIKNNAVKLKTVEFMKNDKYEADDLITAMVKQYKDKDIYIYSGDTDLYQLLRFRNAHIGTKYSRGMVIEPISESDVETCYNKRYGLFVKDASYIVKCKTFKGDTSDNIPIACPGMKTKTIDTLIEKFWPDDEPLTSSILYNMALYLKEYGTKKEYELFFNNRQSLIRNYKLTQLGYSDSKVLLETKSLMGDGQWR